MRHRFNVTVPVGVEVEEVDDEQITQDDVLRAGYAALFGREVLGNHDATTAETHRFVPYGQVRCVYCGRTYRTHLVS